MADAEFPVVSVLAGLVAATALWSLIRPAASIAPPLVAWLLGGGLTLSLGVALQVASAQFLVGVAGFALPVLVALDAAAGIAGGRRWVLALGWGLVVLPIATLVPVALTADAYATEGGFEDFAAGVPLFLSAASAAVFAWVSGRGSVAARSPARTLAATAGIWVAAVAWIASLEGSWDDYLPRLAIAAVVAPAASAIAWSLVRVIADHGTSWHVAVAGGVLVGVVAAAPGAATVSPIGLAVAGAIAGVIGAMTHGARISRRAGSAAQWALTMHAAAVIGVLTPAVAREGLGVIYSARIGFLSVPLLLVIAVTALGAAVSLAAWWRRR